MITVITKFIDGIECFAKAECTNTLNSIYLPVKSIEFYQRLNLIYYDFKIDSFILKEDYDIILEKEKKNGIFI